MTTPIYGFMIGTTQGGMVNLESLTVPVMPPKYIYRPYSQPLDLGDGTVRGGGWATTDWMWNGSGNDYILTEQRDQLRTFCTGASAQVYIQTYTNDRDPITPFGSNMLKIFQAVMIWPQEEKRDAVVRMEFIIKFRRLVAV